MTLQVGFTCWAVGGESMSVGGKEEGTEREVVLRCVVV
jgi:hypothetical protein